MKQILGLIYLFVFIFPSCKPKESNCIEGNNTNYFYIGASSLKQTPYFTNPLFDTLNFASDKGDTLQFVKLKTDTTWYYITDSPDPDCPTNNRNGYQKLAIQYFCLKGNSNFSVVQSLKGKSVYDNDRIEINFNNNTFWAYEYWIGASGFSTYLENNFVNNINYKNSIIIYNNSSDTSNSSSAFINSSHGLYKLKDLTKKEIYTIFNN